MRRLRHPARKEKLLRFQMRRGDPVGDRVPRLLSDLELHRPLGLLLHDNRARSDSTALNDIVNVEPNQIAPGALMRDTVS
jgi:hypothetical protein